MKIYIETTVFNWYFDEREGHIDVMELFSRINEFDAYTSQYVVDELSNDATKKGIKMIELITKFDIKLIPATAEAELLAARYVEDGALPGGSLTDATHIACAAANDLNCVVSYNFKHINRPKTKAMTAEINALLGYRPISIFTAKEVLDYEQDYN